MTTPRIVSRTLIVADEPLARNALRRRRRIHESRRHRRIPRRFWVWTAVCAMLPDIDVIALLVRHSVRRHVRPPRDLLTRSSLPRSRAALAAWQIPTSQHPTARTSQPDWRLFLWFTAVTASHGLLDALTNGGRGIGFFAPFSNHRYFFPWRPIQVSPIGVGFFSSRGLRVLASEAGWIWLPSAIIAAFRAPVPQADLTTTASTID